MKKILFKNGFPKISSSVIGKELNRDEINKFIESQEKDPNSYISRSSEFKRRRSEKSEEELREIRSAENLEKIANSNDEILLNSRKMYTLMNLMQNEILTQNENNKEFNDKVDKLVIELKDINEGVNKSKTVSSFFSDLTGNIAVSVMLEYLKLRFYSWRLHLLVKNKEVINIV